MAKKSSKKKAGKKSTTKTRKRKARVQKNGSGGMPPQATFVAGAGGFDDFIEDVDTPLQRNAKTPDERSNTRKYCEAGWEALDIGELRRVEGAKPGWGMNSFQG